MELDGDVLSTVMSDNVRKVLPIRSGPPSLGVQGFDWLSVRHSAPETLNLAFSLCLTDSRLIHYGTKPHSYQAGNFKGSEIFFCP